MLLNHMGRTVLLNAVLDSQLTYAMSVLDLPAGTIDALDRRRRSFVWSGEDKVSGAQCLIAWELACQPKKQGGLGIRNIGLQNKCLLLKLLHRLFHPGDSAWATWIRNKIDLGTLVGDVAGTHWKALADLLPVYRAITSSVVVDGASTSFWHDKWLPDGRLKETFPLLYTHAVDREVSVRDVVTGSIHR